jgi:hypothetical protein
MDERKPDVPYDCVGKFSQNNKHEQTIIKFECLAAQLCPKYNKTATSQGHRNAPLPSVSLEIQHCKANRDGLYPTVNPIDSLESGRATCTV